MKPLFPRQRQLGRLAHACPFACVSVAGGFSFHRMSDNKTTLTVTGSPTAKGTGVKLEPDASPVPECGSCRWRFKDGRCHLLPPALFHYVSAWPSVPDQGGGCSGCSHWQPALTPGK
jgi:hypothetical protein